MREELKIVWYFWRECCKCMILDTAAYSLIVHAKVKHGNLESVWKVYEEMLNRGLQANPYICTLFIGVHCK